MTTHYISSEEKQWIKQKLNYEKFEENKLISILYFTIIWNLFEKECCDGNAKIDTHAENIAKNFSQQCSKSIEKAWEHFYNRYVIDGQISDVFRNFTFRKNDNKNFVQAALRLDERASNEEKMEALLRIAFRLRNNLYHGTKDVSRLYDQNENFKRINHLLMSIIDAKYEARNARI